MPWIEPVARRGDMPGVRAQARQPRDWYEIRNATEDEAEILLYEDIGGWFGATADQFVEELRGVTAPRITLRVNSPGGSVFEGIAIANAIRSHPATVTARVDGIAASIASVITMAADRIVMMPQSQLMIHDASGAVIGNAADMTEMAQLLDKQSDNIADVYAGRAGGTRGEWRTRMRAETWYLAEEAVAAGLADEVMKTPPRETADARLTAAWDLSVFRYAGREQAPSPGADPGLATDIASAIGADVVARLTALVGAAAEGANEEASAVEDTAAPVHHTATVDGTWDSAAHEKRLPSPVPVATAKKMYGWYDGGQVEGGALPKSACKLPHHEVSEDGSPGAANINAVRNALARLPQTDMPDTERAAVEKHLRAHLEDGGGGDTSDASPAADATGVEEPTEGGPRIVIDLRGPADEETKAIVAQLRDTLTGLRPADQRDPDPPEPAATAAPTTEPDTEQVPGSTHEQPQQAAPGTDRWADAVGHLTAGQDNPWGDAVAHLTTPRGAATDA